MRYRLKLCLLLIIYCSLRNANAQLNDAQWMVGPKTSNIDFRTNPPTNDSIQKWSAVRECNAAIADDAGEMLYYTNGIWISGKMSNGDTITNGMNLSPCAFTTQYSGTGMPLPQAAIFLDEPNSNRYYYLFHFSGDTLNRPSILYYSVIDQEGNFGLGEVVQKNVVFYNTGNIMRGGGMTACKHANGSDWWIVMAGKNINRYYVYLLTPNGIADTIIQNIGYAYAGPLNLAYSCFSKDGSKYATACLEGLISVMDFDRCTGEFSNPVTIYNNASTDPVNQPLSGCASLGFSPNGRFLYVVNRLNITQYDLYSPNIQDSIEIAVAITNAQFGQMMLSPNGRIYISTWGGGYYFYHVINAPDELGIDCDFVYAGYPLISGNTYTVSNITNYRLGPLVGSGCDTIPSGIQEPRAKTQQPRVFPNPADKAFYIEMPAQGNYVFELLNEAGQVVERRETKQVDIINVQGLPSGQYFLSVTDKSGRGLSTLPVIVQH